MADGLRKLKSIYSSELGDRTDKKNFAIILTDGVATLETENTLTEASLLRDGGVYLFGIGIGAELDITELQKIVSVNERVY